MGEADRGTDGTGSVEYRRGDREGRGAAVQRDPPRSLGASERRRASPAT